MKLLIYVNKDLYKALGTNLKKVKTATHKGLEGIDLFGNGQVIVYCNYDVKDIEIEWIEKVPKKSKYNAVKVLFNKLTGGRANEATN